MATTAPKNRRLSLTDPSDQPKPLVRLLTVREVAKILGTWETSGERFPRRLIEERRITFVKVGRHVRIPETAIAEFIAANTVQPIGARRNNRRSAA